MLKAAVLSWFLGLSGGTALVTYQPGVVEGLLETLGMPCGASGVSSGALTAAGVGMGPDGFALVKKIMLEINGTKDFQNPQVDVWNGVFSLKPLEKLLRKHKIAKTLLIPVYVGVTDLATGEFLYVLLNDLEWDERIVAILASCTQPLIHADISFRGREVADGGLRNVIPGIPPSFGGDVTKLICVASSPIEEGFRLPVFSQDEVKGAFGKAQAAFAFLMANTVLSDVQELRETAKQRNIALDLYAPKSWGVVGRPFQASNDWMFRRYKAGKSDFAAGPRMSFARGQS